MTKTMSGTARVIRLAQRPGSDLRPEDFGISEVALPELADGEVLVRNTWMSLDPYMRLPLTGQAGVHAPMAVGAEMEGAAIGVVERSAAPALPVGATVMSRKGWRDRFVAPAAGLQRADGEFPPQWRLGVMGLTGLTAYAGVEFVLKPAAGETLFVSGAAGAVGSIACQLAKRRGARVVATAGSAEKVEWLLGEVGVDAAGDYKREDVGAFLARACPDGLDTYFDNVGGATLDAALGAMKPWGRIGLCGAIAQYDDDNYRAGPRDFFTIIEKGLTVTGFNAGLWGARAGSEMLPALGGMLARGELVWRETVVDGLEAAPAAFVSLFDGRNVGKLLVRL
jgi:NADPH-dependent curcumin reductase CurA